MTEKLRHKREYYFYMYFKKAELAKETRELILQLNLTKKEIIESETYLKAVQYTDMPKSIGSNPDKILDNLIKREDKIENIDNRIQKALKKQEDDFLIFDNIDKMVEDLTEIQRQVFVLTYRDHTRRVETAYNLCVSERTVQYIKKEILEKANFIQEY